MTERSDIHKYSIFNNQFSVSDGFGLGGSLFFEAITSQHTFFLWLVCFNRLFFSALFSIRGPSFLRRYV